MKNLLKIFLIVLFSLLHTESIKAVEINCSSPVHKNKPKCKGKTSIKNNEFDSWFPIGVNENRIAVAWVQYKSYEPLNENSFRVKGKFTYPNNLQYSGNLDFNCKNKDYYFRPKGIWGQGPDWASIPQGSGIEMVAKYFCKRTKARSEWGYTDATAYLWNVEPPVGEPSNLDGEWILQYDKDDGEGYYNTSTIKKNMSVIYGNYSRARKGDRSASKPFDTSQYYWINNSCKENLASVFYKPDISVEGVWLSPVPGQPGGTQMAVRKKYCK